MVRIRQAAGRGTGQVPAGNRRQPGHAGHALGWCLAARNILVGWRRGGRAVPAVLARSWRSAQARHPALRYAQIAPIAVLLWGLDDAASLRAGAAADGLRHASDVHAVSMKLGGALATTMNDWLAANHLAAIAATWYYILLQGAITGVVGLLLIVRRAPRLALHRNALIAVTAFGLVAFWLYPVAPPRLLDGYHDIVASTVPMFTSIVEPNGSATYAALPSLHVAWALWAVLACWVLVRRPVLRVLLVLYPVATITDVLATANHYPLDVVTAPGLLLLAYAIVTAPGLARGMRARRRRGAIAVHGAVLACALPARDDSLADGHRTKAA